MDDPRNVPGGPVASQFVATAYIGPAFAGWSTHLIFYGMVANAFANYLSTDLYRKDTRRTQIILWLVVILDTASMAVNWAENFIYGTRQRRDAETLYMTEILDTMPVILLGLLAATVQSTLALRASSVFGSRRALRTAFICIMAFLIFMAWIANVGSSILNVMICFNTEAQAAPFTYNSLAGTYLWCAAAIDLAISSTLVFQIRSLKSGASTDSLLSTIATTAMRAAVPTTLFAFVGALMATIFTSDRIATVNAVFAFNLPLPSLYTISFIYTLSSRQTFTPSTKREDLSGDASYPLHGFSGLGGVEVQHEVVVRTEVDLDGLLFRNRTVDSAPPRASSGAAAQGAKWDRERDCADW
ncbi:hypothetical protein BCR35DRAFT_300856 [Leucosporidium creatinivorum]|uniref:Uncharacterized protein n=1 Tax=Leucosporidium creatinivorum TaxID=106004 RepID=A0A1Y2G2F4_9BASI|nr:hypothetical protein BCR35DRAFT_300856 [Leucosporidium creatinivorum]